MTNKPNLVCSGCNKTINYLSHLGLCKECQGELSGYKTSLFIAQPKSTTKPTLTLEMIKELSDRPLSEWISLCKYPIKPGDPKAKYNLDECWKALCHYARIGLEAEIKNFKKGYPKRLCLDCGRELIPPATTYPPHENETHYVKCHKCNLEQEF